MPFFSGGALLLYEGRKHEGPFCPSDGVRLRIHRYEQSGPQTIDQW